MNTIVQPAIETPAWANLAESDADEGTFVRTLAGTDEFSLQLVQFNGEKPTIRIWAGDYLDLPVDADLGAISAIFQKAERDLFEILNPGSRIVRCIWVESVMHLVIYRHVADGVDHGERVIPSRGIDGPYPSDDLASKLRRLSIGESIESDFKMGPGVPREHRVDTFLGEYEIIRRNPDRTAYVRLVTEADL